MKKSILIILIFILLFTAAIVSYGNELGIENDILTNDQLFSLIPQEFEKYFTYNDTIDHEALKSFNGEFFLNYIFNSISSELHQALYIFLTLLALTVVTSIASAFAVNMSPSNASTLDFAVTICSSASVFYLIYDIVLKTIDTVDSFNALLSSFAPIISAIYIAEGKAASGITAATGTLFLVSVISLLAHSVLLPAIRICFAFEIISALSPDSPLSSVSSFVKNTFTYLSGTVMTVLTAVFTFQNVVSQSADNATLRAARFAVGTLPLVGGTLAEASRTIIGAVDLMKSLTGTLGIIILLLMVLPSLIQLFLTQAAISLSRMLSDGLKCKKAAIIMKGCEDIISFAIAVLIIFNITSIFIMSVFLMITG